MSAARLIGLAWPAFVWLALALFASGCTTSRQADRNAPPASQFAGEASQGSGDVSLVPVLPEPVLADGGGGITAGDVLAVQVFGVPELDRTVQVDAGGQIALPLIGAVRAAGQSPRALERSVAQLYGARYLEAPQVGVIVKESFGQRVTVDGAVDRAGMYSSAGDASLLQIIALAGGFGPTADPSRVIVFRKVGAKRYAASFDMKRVREGRAADPLVAGGDVVIVPDSSSKLARNNLKDILGLAGSVGTLAALGL
ncbi:MAG: polysaccharide export protein [Methylobacterium mesophilicum]|nr:polysaccharide export protein [Methylobacterium mesophilicum]